MSENNLYIPGILRSLKPREDLDVVAGLIEDAFELKNDPDGQYLIQQMRDVARRWRLDPLIPRYASSNESYVWDVNGEVVANITLIPFIYNFKRYYLLANVAVREDYRRRGIAARLTEHALRVLRQRGIQEIWLQVRSDNQAAIAMYHQHNFRFVQRFNHWKHPFKRNSLQLPAYTTPVALRTGRRHCGDWKLQEAWLAVNYPLNTRWYANTDFRAFSPLAWLNPLKWESLLDLQHYCLSSEGQTRAILTWQRSDTRSDHLFIACDKTEQEDFFISHLLQSFLKNDWNGKVLTLEYPWQRAEKGMVEAGFQLARSLDWMRYFTH